MSDNPWLRVAKASPKPPQQPAQAQAAPVQPQQAPPQAPPQQPQQQQQVVVDAPAPAKLAIVLDTAAFIKGVELSKFDADLFTTAAVLAEVRDRAARQAMELRLGVDDVAVRVADDAARKAVSAFAKKTGDFARLSATDLGVVALAYQLERERQPNMDHIRTSPPVATLKVGQSNPSHTGGLVIGSHKQDNEGGQPQPSAGGNHAGENGGNEPQHNQPAKETPAGGKEADHAMVEGEGDEAEPQADQGENGGEGEGEGEGEADDDEESGGEWITPENISSHMKQDVSRFREPVDASVRVVCLTTDFAMQNVLLQMNLRVLSVEGMLIKSVRLYAQKCQACFTVTHEMERQFCDHCGNATLYRVAIITDKDGNVVHYNARPPKNRLRGTKYSIPKPVAGRNANNIVLREDQYHEQLRKQPRQKQAMCDVFDLNFQFGDQRNTQVSRSGRPAQRDQGDVKIGYGRTNPNASKRSGKKKKKR